MSKKYAKKSVLNLRKNKKKLCVIAIIVAVIILITLIIYNKTTNVFILLYENIILETHQVEESAEIIKDESEYVIEEVESEEELAARIELERIEEIKNIIYFYADVYSLDQEIIYEIISNETDDFTSEDFYNLIINDMIVKNRKYTAYTVEELIIITIRDIYYNTSDYGYAFSNVYTGIEYVTNLSASEQLGVISNVFNIDKYVMYGITVYETGNFKSSLYINKNNPGGIKFSSEWASFPSTYAGFIESVLIIHGYTVIDGLSTIGEIGAKYALQEGENSSWATNVRNYMDDAYENEEELFLNTDEYFEYVNKLYIGEL